MRRVQQAIFLAVTALAIGGFGTASNSAFADTRDERNCDQSSNQDLSIAGCTRLIQLNPKDAAPYNNRGMAYNAKGDHDRAIADYDHAIGLDPKAAIAYYNRGNALETSNRLREAFLFSNLCRAGSDRCQRPHRRIASSKVDCPEFDGKRVGPDVVPCCRSRKARRACHRQFDLSKCGSCQSGLRR
jgi:TPR repeat